MLTRDFETFIRRIGKASKPQGRFKTDNRDRKDPNKLKSKGNTMKRKYFLENTLSLPIVDNLDTNVLSTDAHLVHHFIDELSSIVLLPHLLVESLINLSMEDIDEGIEEGSERSIMLKEKEALDFGNFESLAYGQVYVREYVIDFSPANIAHYLSCLHSSDTEGASLEEEDDFDEVKKVLTGVTGAI
ncbi:hypothetical protein M9H77_35750 [Catharanthus roseus]|uniref:Uncharacterized protein n=1 Tax=Catharanthus roseus TaxID=4058 RepID=A0ACB9ZQ68_CATRO|nr:hypothetical protein M9H77_35750 [Catharanthus roseus]